MSEKRLTQAEIESHLKEAANMLRGYIDAGDYKQFIFPLLFFKRICDVYDEEVTEALEESSGDEDYAANFYEHRFMISPECHWNTIRETAKDVGDAIKKALRGIERDNKDTLGGIFGDAKWTNKERLSDETLKDLIERFSMFKLDNTHAGQDELGNAYEFLIKHFADDSGHTAAEFYTNRTLVELMTYLLDIESGESVYDPTCGTGGMLLNSALHLRNMGQEYRSLKLYGQEINHITSAVARMNMYLHGIETFDIRRGDTLDRPLFETNGKVRTFDAVLANPPYSIKKWDRVKWENDSRNKYGVPPQGCADYAFFQHIIASLDKTTGRCAILFPHGVLFRDIEQEMRAKIVTEDLVECVIGLGPNLFYNSPMEACIVICRKKKPAINRGKVLFVNAVNQVKRERSESFLTPDQIENINKTYKDFKDVTDFAKVVNLSEIERNMYNLSIPLYVEMPTSNSIVKEQQSEYTIGNLYDNWCKDTEVLYQKLDDLVSALEHEEVEA